MPAIEARDLLDDLDEVLGDDRVKLRDLVGLLRGLAPAWGAYQRMTAKQLAHGICATWACGRSTRAARPYLDPLDLRRVIAERSTEDLDEEVSYGPPWE